MKNLPYILLLLSISTGYLFSQTEENEIIQRDTVIIVDTVIVTRVDTIMLIEHNDTLAVKLSKTNPYVISANLGGGVLGIFTTAILSCPTSEVLSFVLKYRIGALGFDTRSNLQDINLALGLGGGIIVKGTDGYISKINCCIGVIFEQGLYLSIEYDMLYKLFKHYYLSVGPEVMLVNPNKYNFVGIHLGLNGVF